MRYCADERLASDDGDGASAKRLRTGAGREFSNLGPDDGIRAWIDDELVIDHWEYNYSSQAAAMDFVGAARKLRVEYFQHGADAQLWTRFEPVMIAKR